MRWISLVPYSFSGDGRFALADTIETFERLWYSGAEQGAHELETLRSKVIRVLEALG